MFRAPGNSTTARCFEPLGEKLEFHDEGVNTSTWTRVSPCLLYTSDAADE